MAKLVFGMMQSLDGYVAGVGGGPQLPPPGDELHRHFNDHVRALAGMVSGEIDVAGPELAGSLTGSGLIDEYRLYFRPFVLGRGKPYFAGPVPALHYVGTEPVGEDAIRLTYSAMRSKT